MYTRSSRFYDMFTMEKDYGEACRQLKDVFQTLAPHAESLLDVGCGTGRHLEHFQNAYAVSGLDSSRQMLRVARRRCVNAFFHQCDLSRFDLGRRFDVITCLFGSIAYARTASRLKRAVRCLAAHLNPGGLLVIEPWVSADAFVAGRVVHDSATDGEATVGRMYSLRRARNRAVLDVHYLVGRPRGVAHFSERHQLGLFSDANYRAALSDAGLTAVDVERKLFGYGMYVAVNGSVNGSASHTETTTHASVSVRQPYVSVMRPRLPTADQIMPYLRRIDASRVYTNNGPLVQEFEARLARHFRQCIGCVTTASSGTHALVGAILSTAGRARRTRPLAIMPAFTFVATALAAEQCGYRPCFVDVDPSTFQIDAERCERSAWLPRAGVVIPVAPFGRPVPLSPWRSFRDRTGIPVVVDGAASFEAVAASNDTLGGIPVCMSFHATKGFGIGEGGCVVTDNAALAARISRALNFGFYLGREIESAAVNGRLSEYHAAVGLAELDAWKSKSLAVAAVAARYRRHMGEAGLADRLLAAPAICSTNVLFRCSTLREAATVRMSLEERGIEHRLWYGHGLHQQPYFAAHPRESLSVTDRILPCLIGLPMAVDLRPDVIATIVSAVTAGLGNVDDVPMAEQVPFRRGLS